MKELIKNIEGFITITALIFMLWLLISWGDVIVHNDPCGGDGQPHAWNAFVLITEVARFRDGTLKRYKTDEEARAALHRYAKEHGLKAAF